MLNQKTLCPDNNKRTHNCSTFQLSALKLLWETWVLYFNNFSKLHNTRCIFNVPQNSINNDWKQRCQNKIQGNKHESSCIHIVHCRHACLELPKFIYPSLSNLNLPQILNWGPKVSKMAIIFYNLGSAIISFLSFHPSNQFLAFRIFGFYFFNTNSYIISLQNHWPPWNHDTLY